MRDVLVGEGRLGLDLLGQAAEAGAQDDADTRLAWPAALNSALGVLDLVED